MSEPDSTKPRKGRLWTLGLPSGRSSTDTRVLRNDAPKQGVAEQGPPGWSDLRIGGAEEGVHREAASSGQACQRHLVRTGPLNSNLRVRGGRWPLEERTDAFSMPRALEVAEVTGAKSEGA